MFSPFTCGRIQQPQLFYESFSFQYIRWISASVWKRTELPNFKIIHTTCWEKFCVLPQRRETFIRRKAFMFYLGLKFPFIFLKLKLFLINNFYVDWTVLHIHIYYFKINYWMLHDRQLTCHCKQLLPLPQPQESLLQPAGRNDTLHSHPNMKQWIAEREGSMGKRCGRKRWQGRKKQWLER